MKVKYLLFAFPLLIGFNILAIKVTNSLLNKTSDAAVFGGVILLCLLIGLNLILVRYILAKIRAK